MRSAMLCHMEISQEALKRMLPSLRDRGSAPPRDAIMTLIALTGEAPEHLVTLQLDDNRWQIVALHETGIVVVTVDPGAEAHWSLEHDRRPEGAKVLGHHYPVRAVESIEVRNARIFQRSWVESGLDIHGCFEYAIHVPGGTVEFPRDPSGREHATTEFVRELQSRL
ncbi:hypothetical protein FBY41_1534 [Humibacillus xanthopallidus]|uniref:Uncharacterized protein n=2 Tax=Humibacillus xanthopallidus TaxID=412689 RepID=A0A543I3H7_9MICO|nr:hypothetical protein FBY41_1534 [Humibacillus xanthopallidus]